MPTYARALVLVCLVALGARTVAAGEPVWVRVATTNFVVYSDAGEKRARQVAERLEGFRALLTSLFPNSVTAGRTGQVPVVAFRNDGAFKPYKPLYNGKPVNVAGLFLGGHERSLIALDVSAWEGSSHVIFHEYIHKLMAAKELAFTTDDKSTLIFATLGRGSIKHERIDCGKALEREAFVQFDRAPGASAGVLKAVLFTGPAK